MAVINRDQVITDDALKAPLILKENFEQLYATINTLMESMKKFQSEVNSGDALPKIKKDTEDVTQAQIELIKIQNQIATAVAKDNDAYREQQAILASVKNELKNNQALQDTTKAFNAQYASLTELEKALNSNRIAFANLRGEEERNSKQGQELLKNIQDQAKSVAELRDKMGQHKITAEDFGKKMEENAGVAKKFAAEGIEAGESTIKWGAALLVLVSSPIAFGLAVLSAAYAGLRKAVDLYIEGTVEGADKANVFSAYWDTAIEVLNGKLKRLGKTMFDTITDPDNAKSVIGGLVTAAPGLAALIAVLAKATGFFDDYSKKLKQNIEIREIENEIRKEEIRLTVELAENRLKADEALFEARDKVHNVNEERYNELLKANALIKEGERLKLEANAKERELIVDEILKKDSSLKKDITAIELLNLKGESYAKNYELIEKLAAVEAKRSEIENEVLQGARRRQALEASLVEDEEKRQITITEAGTEAKIKLQEVYAERIKLIQEKITGNEQYSIDRQVEAQNLITQQLIILDNDKAEREKLAAKKAALERVHLTQDELDEVYSIEGLNYEQRVERLIAFKEKEITNDKAYNNQLQAIDAQHIDAQKQIVLKGTTDISNIYEKYYQDVANKARLGQNETNQQIEQAYQDGKISLLQYNIFREFAEQDFKIKKDEILIDELESEKFYLENKATLTKEEELKLTETKNKLQEAELQHLKDHNARKLKIDQEYLNLRITLENKVADTIRGIGDGLFDSSISRKTKEIEATKEQERILLEEAGNNADAKAKITRRYAAIEKQEQDELAAKKREKAIFDKAISAAQVLIKTAEGVSAQLPGLPYTAPLIALIEGIGAAEEALILATPIAAYKHGTKHAKQGLSIIDDGAGNEIVQEPSGRAYMYDVPGAKLVNLQEGSRVFTAEQSREIERSIVPQFSISKGSSTVNHVIDMTPLVKEFSKLEKAFNKKQNQVIMIKHNQSWHEMIAKRYK